MSVSADRLEALIVSLLTSLDAVTGQSNEDAKAASRFLAFKLDATLHIGDQIREELKTPISSLMGAPDGALKVAHNRGGRFGLYVLVDAFLFESVSIRDALLQFVNVAFGLGIAENCRSLDKKVRQRLGVTDTSATGLEEWITPKRYPTWFHRLITLRNTATHRQPVRLPTHITSHLSGTGPDHTIRVTIERGDGGFDPLDEFIDRTEENVIELLKVSLDRLGVLLAKGGSPSRS